MTNIPAIVRILAVFFGMLLLSRLRVRIGIAVLAGAVSLNFVAGAPPEQLITTLGSALARPYLWLLLAVTVLVLGLGRYMCEKRNAGAILSIAQRWGGRHGRMWSLMAAPAVIGLVPMAAGALFSAPMVQDAASEDHWASDWKVAVNYWFRHVWEYWWPVYPGVIVALAVFEMEMWQFILAMIVFTPVTLATGYWFLMRPQKEDLSVPRKESAVPNRPLFRVLLPLLIMIIFAVFLPSFLRRVLPAMDPQTRKLLAMFIGLIAALGIVLIEERKQGLKNIWSAIGTGSSLNLLLTVGSVIIFQDNLSASGLLPEAGMELLKSGIPLMLVVAILPILAGLLMGLAIGFTGIAFPLVVGIMNAEGSGLTPMATLVLAFGCGYMGMMMSPVHLCLVVTRDFFSAPLLAVYRRILPCVCVLLAFTFLLHGVFRVLGW